MSDSSNFHGWKGSPSLARRDFLSQFATGLGGIALASLLPQESKLKARALDTPTPAILPHIQPKARRAVQIFLQGGLSQVDSFDYKPALARYHGKALPGD